MNFPPSTIIQKSYFEPPVDYSDDDDDDDNNYIVDYNNNNHDCILQMQPESYYYYYDNYNDNNDNDDDSDYYYYYNEKYSNHSISPTINNSSKINNLTIPIINFNEIIIDKLIGRGGFGKVYRGYYHKKTIAIKEPIYYYQCEQYNTVNNNNNNNNNNSIINQSLKNEAILQFHLDHPNIIKIYGLSMNDKNNKIYLIMEYAEGRSLRELLSKYNLSPLIITNFAKQIASAMKYLHSIQPKPIIHRDLKTSNILLELPVETGNWRKKQIKLTDLGLAREFTDSSSIMSSHGTCAWMAPESITKSKFSKSSDVWSFGVVLWELLTAEIPYKNLASAAVLYGIGNGQLKLPIPKTCPNELRQILEECWQNDPKLRPSFNKIYDNLEKSSFNVIEMEEFQQMKKKWSEEIYSNIKINNNNGDGINNLQTINNINNNDKQIDLVKTELELLLKKNQIFNNQNKNNLSMICYNNNNNNNRLLMKKMKFSKQKTPPIIGYPENFCHYLTVMKTSHNNINNNNSNDLFILKAKELNRTWTPGMKIRSAIKTNFTAKNILQDDSISKEFEIIDINDINNDNSDDLYNNNNLNNNIEPKQLNKTKKSSMKKLSNYIKKFFTLNNYLQQQQKYKINDGNVDNNGDDYNLIKDDKNLIKLRQTYHGQTKHSQRKPIHLFDSFIMEKKQPEPEPEPDCNINSDDYLYNLLYKNNNSTRTLSTITMQSTSDDVDDLDLDFNNKKIDDDLRQKYDQFELELQSLRL